MNASFLTSWHFFLPFADIVAIGIISEKHHFVKFKKL